MTCDACYIREALCRAQPAVDAAHCNNMEQCCPSVTNCLYANVLRTPTLGTRTHNLFFPHPSSHIILACISISKLHRRIHSTTEVVFILIMYGPDPTLLPLKIGYRLLTQSNNENTCHYLFFYILISKKKNRFYSTPFYCILFYTIVSPSHCVCVLSHITLLHPLCLCR